MTFLNKMSIFAVIMIWNNECKMNIDRIIAMEQRFEKAGAAMDALEATMEQYLSIQEDIEVLDDYLGSDEWHADRADDEAGRLPEGLRRGVLSEDGIWNLLEHNREMKAQLKKKYSDGEQS